MNNNFIRNSVFIFLVFLAGVLQAGNPAVRPANKAIEKIKPVNYDFLSSGKLSISTYNNFKRIFQSTPATPPIYSKHYIAPAPWQYWSKANQIVITTESTSTVSGTITKSDGTHLFDFTCSAGIPYIQRFNGRPGDLPIHPLNTIVSGGGLFVIASGSIAVNLRNIASDDLGNDGNDANIKGNASLFSFGDAGVGTSFRVGYYRDGNLAGSERPIYSIMALDDDTDIKIDGLTKAKLNKGQSYLFQCPIGTLVESTRPTVMNTSARLDAPGGCGDGAYNPIPPVSSLGTEYVIVRGEGNLIAEQTTIVSTEPNTTIRVEFFDENGGQRSSQDITLASAGAFRTFNHGWINGNYNTASNTGRFSSSRIVSDKNILVFSGTGGVSGGGGCEVDIATLVPIDYCSGSRQVETYKFTSYKNSDLPYFGYIITKNTDKIYLTTKGATPYNSKDIETIQGIGPRKALGNSGLYLIKFTDANINYPDILTINSTIRLTVSMVQQSSDFSMSNFISRFPEKALLPTVDLTNCAAAILTAEASSEGPYKWFFNGVEIPGAVSNTYTATVSGNYTVSSMLDCGLSAQSLPLIITLCSIDRAIEKTVDKPLPELGETVTFKLTAKNLGPGNAIGVSVNDKLPVDYEYVSHNTSTGSYNATTGIWTIGDLASGANSVLEIRAKVLTQGSHTNTATIAGTQPDANPNNDVGTASTTTELGVITLISPAPDRTVCIGMPIEDIVYSVGGGASGVTVTDLPAGFTSTYNSTTKELKITGSSNTPTSPEGVVYTVTTTGGIPVSKTGRIIVKANVSSPVFANNLTTSRCIGSGNDRYVATADNSDGIVYELTPATAGTIERTTGVVTWSPSFYGAATITAIATGCNEKRSELPVNINPRPATPVTRRLEYCQNQTGVPVLTAIGEANAIFTWYDESGNVIDGSIPPSTSAVGIKTYYVTQKIGVNGCESEKSALEVTIKSVPPAPGTSHLEYCQNQTGVPVLTASGETNAIFTWYDASGIVIDGSIPPSTSAVGIKTYYVTQKIGVNGCESLKSPLKVTINPLPDAPVTANLTYCYNQQNIPALTADGSNLNWYDVNGTKLPAAPIPSTSSAGETKYYVTGTNAQGCEGPKAELKVTVIALPTAPVTAHLTYCQNETNIPALTATGDNLTWYDANGTKLSAAPIPSTSSAGETKYYVTLKNAGGCEGPKAELKVTVIALPTAPVTANLTYCQNETNVNALKAIGDNLTWYDANGTKLSAAPIPSTSSAGETKYYVTLKNAGGCEGPKAELKVTVIALPTAPLTAHLTYCHNQQNIPALTADGSNLTWYDANGTKLSAAPIPSTSSAGETKYYVTGKNAGGCEGPKAELKVTVIALPTAPVTRPLTYCQNQQDIPVLTADGENLKWYDEQGNLLDRIPIPSTSLPGVKNYYVTQSNASGCESAKATVAITIIAKPGKPTISASGPVIICEGGSVVLKSSLSGFYQWFKDGIVLNGENKQTLNVTQSGQYSIVTSNSNGCTSESSELINVNVIPIPQRPAITYQGALNICEGNAVVLKSSVTEGNQWFKDNVLIPGANAQTYVAKEGGSYNVSVTTLPGCVSPFAEPVLVTVNSIEEAPVINTQSDLVICKGGTATLKSSASTGNQWYKDGVLIPGAVGATYIAASSGKYTVKHKNPSGCESPGSNAIDLTEQAFKISLNANTNVASYGSKVTLNVNSNLKYKILSWSPSNLFQEVDARSQTIVLEKDLNITINAVSENGCLATANVAIQVKKTKDLYIPNTFTPNGDGKNDVIKVYATGIETVDWAVYSQWGQLIYKSKAQDASWDGTFRGVIQPVGVYVYKCVVRFRDGEEITRHGSINLVR